MTLSAIEQRVLGALIEKEITTPENYPLSLNSLHAAANQRSSRDPVMDLSEEDVRSALQSLEQLGLVNPFRDARVPKWEHRARTVLNLRRDETAALCLLLLRGPQTPGELRARADRLYTFTDLEAVVATLDRLASRPASSPEIEAGAGPLTAMLPRQPGARENRYTHLLGEPAADAGSPRPDEFASPAEPPGAAPAALAARNLAALEQRLCDLEHRISLLEQRETAGIASPGAVVQ